MLTEETIYAGQYSYRKQSVAGVGSLLLIVAVGFVTGAFLSGDFVLLVVSAFPGGLGFAFLRLYFRRATFPFAITNDGVTYGTSVKAWERIRGFALYSVDGHLHFCVRRTGLRPDLRLTTDSVVTLHEIEDVIDRLQHFLETKHPTIYVESHVA